MHMGKMKEEEEEERKRERERKESSFDRMLKSFEHEIPSCR